MYLCEWEYVSTDHVQIAGLNLLAHLSRRLKGELIVHQSSRRLDVWMCGCMDVHTFKLEYLRNQWANRNAILSEPALG